jgi:preprotein translocase subunit SecF
MRILESTNINFLKWRWHALALSMLVIVAGLYTIVSRGGVPLGVDFSGGTVLMLRFEQPVDEGAIRAALPQFGDVVVQRVAPPVGSPDRNEIMIRLPIMQEAEQGANLEAQGLAVEAALKAAGLPTFIVEDRTSVGPIMGADLRRKGMWATLLSLGGILGYIWFRFRLTFAVGAIAATLHDVIVTVIFLTWFGYDISLNVVAALLTITGYSVNDTIVIFDRVRENQRTARKEALESVVNRSVNQTLSRTIITAGTTFLAVVALFLFGGPVLSGLAFTLLVGILTGTYSTVFIASAIAIVLSPRRQAEPAQPARRRA